ncbi:hypothetical protein GTA51_00005 [Desulfovibrio aerotolerans]|uniref:Uncharacterized protein n=2 Tax=Solidesulfovibrio aerotolerans TaxID=295255 RepID=A0A7C9IIN2_9BACT|nr:hypothetical protein [Solidesulfovibrio aerotolerans]
MVRVVVRKYLHHAALGSGGSSVLFAIFGITVLASLAASIARMSPSAAQTKLAGVNETRAYYMALSGLNVWSAGTTGTYSLADGSFTLSQTGPDASGYYTVTSLGCVDPGKASEANHTISARRKSAKPITFEDNIDDFILPKVGETTNNARSILVFDRDLTDAPPGVSQSDWATLWATNVDRYAGGWMRFGSGLGDSTGAIWYGGDYGLCPQGVCPDGACKDGACNLGQGLRAYFRFAFSDYDASADSTRCADGFTFAVVTAANDPATACGGPASGSRGEYLGYAGPGPAGVGIAPPKIAVEVDIYPNTGNGKPSEANSRADASNANHVAVLYWGGNANSYDDNTHSAGNKPGNPGKNSSGYYEMPKTAVGANGLEDGLLHALRLEIHRTSAGVYRVKTWIDPQGLGNSDVTADYAAEPPQLDHSATLSEADHAGLKTIRFGWTEGTGGQTQTVAVANFSLDFRH